MLFYIIFIPPMPRLVISSTLGPRIHGNSHGFSLPAGG